MITVVAVDCGQLQSNMLGNQKKRKEKKRKRRRSRRRLLVQLSLCVDRTYSGTPLARCEPTYETRHLYIRQLLEMSDELQSCHHDFIMTAWMFLLDEVAKVTSIFFGCYNKSLRTRWRKCASLQISFVCFGEGEMYLSKRAGVLCQHTAVSHNELQGCLNHKLTGHFIRYTLLVPGWTSFCLQNCLRSS